MQVTSSASREKSITTNVFNTLAPNVYEALFHTVDKACKTRRVHSYDTLAHRLENVIWRRYRSDVKRDQITTFKIWAHYYSQLCSFEFDLKHNVCTFIVFQEQSQ